MNEKTKRVKGLQILSLNSFTKMGIRNGMHFNVSCFSLERPHSGQNASSRAPVFPSLISSPFKCFHPSTHSALRKHSSMNISYSLLVCDVNYMHPQDSRCMANVSLNGPIIAEHEKVFFQLFFKTPLVSQIAGSLAIHRHPSPDPQVLGCRASRCTLARDIS